MSSTPHPDFDRRPTLREAMPLLAVALVLAFVGFTSWFWQSEDDDLLGLLPLYVAALLFCVDMIFLRNRLHGKSRDIY